MSGLFIPVHKATNGKIFGKNRRLAMITVTLYTRENCPACEQVVRDLAELQPTINTATISKAVDRFILASGYMSDVRDFAAMVWPIDRSCALRCPRRTPPRSTDPSGPCDTIRTPAMCHCVLSRKSASQSAPPNRCRRWRYCPPSSARY